MKYELGLFSSAKSKVDAAGIDLDKLSSVITSLQNISDAYEGKDLVDSVCNNLDNLSSDIEDLDEEMLKTIGLMEHTEGIDGNNESMSTIFSFSEASTDAGDGDSIKTSELQMSMGMSTREDVQREWEGLLLAEGEARLAYEAAKSECEGLEEEQLQAQRDLSQARKDEEDALDNLRTAADTGDSEKIMGAYSDYAAAIIAGNTAESMIETIDGQLDEAKTREGIAEEEYQDATESREHTEDLLKDMLYGEDDDIEEPKLDPPHGPTDSEKSKNSNDGNYSERTPDGYTTNNSSYGETIYDASGTNPGPPAS